MKKQINKILALILCVMMIIPVASFASFADESVIWDGTAASDFAGGTGTVDDPFKIATAAQLKLLANNIEDDESDSDELYYYEITNDIYLNDISDFDNWTSATTGLNEWRPMGSRGTSGNTNMDFYGIVDGKGHTVYGMFISTQYYEVGLFGLLQTGSEIKNLNVSHSFIGAASSQGGASVYHATGMLAAWANAGASISNCSTSGRIVADAKGSVGGIVGSLASTGTAGKISNCANYTDITINSTAESNTGMGVGGIAGIVGRSTSSTIENCYNEGNITFNTVIPEIQGHGVAGIAGLVRDASHTIKNCLNVGTISTNSTITPITSGGNGIGAGGIVGKAIAAPVLEACVNTGNVIRNNSAAMGVLGHEHGSITVTSTNCYYVAANGMTDTAEATGLSLTDMQASTNLTGLSTEKWILTDGELPMLKNIPTQEFTTLGAQIRENWTIFQKNGQTVAEGQGLRFGFSLDISDYGTTALANGYSVQIIIADKDSLSGNVLTTANKQYTITATNTIEITDGVMTFSGHLIGIDMDNLDTEFAARAVLVKGGMVIAYSDIMEKSVSGVATELGGALDSGGNYLRQG